MAQAAKGITLLGDVVVSFARDVLLLRVRCFPGGIDDQAYFDGGIGAVLSSVDIGSSETDGQQVPIRFKVLIDVSVVVHIAFHQLPFSAQPEFYFFSRHNVELSHVVLRSFLDRDI